MEFTNKHHATRWTVELDHRYGARRGAAGGSMSSRSTWMVCAVLGLAGCFVPTEGEVDVNAAALTAWSTRDFWPNGTVPVCFQPRTMNLLGTSAYEDLIDEIQAAIENYENLSDTGINFTGWQTCPDAASGVVGGLTGQVRITVSPSNTGNWVTRYCAPGTPIGQSFDSSVCNEPHDRTSEASVWATGAGFTITYAMHEIGHVLGAAGHEHERADNSDDANDRDPECNNSTDPNKWIASGAFLTTYDEFSIMKATYCGLWPEGISPKDALGFEMMYYAGDFVQGVRGFHHLPLPNGVVLRTDDTPVTEWTARGAADQAFPSQVTWAVPGSTATYLGVVYEGPPPPTGVLSPMNAIFDDFRGRRHLASGNVLVSDSAHTALALAIIGG